MLISFLNFFIVQFSFYSRFLASYLKVNSISIVVALDETFLNAKL